MNRISIVEDDGAVAASLGAILKAWKFETQTFPTGEEFLSNGGDTDCILLDVRLPGKDGLSVLAEFRETNAGTPVIVMTGHGDVRMAVQAFHMGAQDFVEKPFDAEDLVARMKKIIKRSSEAAQCQRAVARLTPREREVLKELLEGHANKVIAYNLGISPKTVELHRARVMKKTEAQSLSQLVRIAMKARFATDPSEA